MSILPDYQIKIFIVLTVIGVLTFVLVGCKQQPAYALLEGEVPCSGVICAKETFCKDGILYEKSIRNNVGGFMMFDKKNETISCTG